MEYTSATGPCKALFFLPVAVPFWWQFVVGGACEGALVALGGHPAVEEIQIHTPNLEEIFVSYEELKGKYGNAMKDIPLGAIGIYTFSQKLRVGLQQLMAGSRNFKLSLISREDLMALTEEAAKISGIPYVMQAYRPEAEQILAE